MRKRKAIKIEQEEKELIEILVETRKNLKLTQKEAADLAGMKPPALARFEKCKVTPRIDTLIRIAHALGLKVVLSLKEAEEK